MEHHPGSWYYLPVATPEAKGPVKKGSAPRNSSATLAVPSLRIYVRQAFYSSYSGAKGECWFPGSGIEGMTFEIDGKAVTGKKSTTGAPHKVTAGLVLTVPIYAGDPILHTSKRVAARAKAVEATEATLSLAGVTDGEHILEAIPPAQGTSAGPAGPPLTSKEARLFRPLHIRFSVKNGLLTDAVAFDPKDAKATVTHGRVTAFKADELCLDIKPDWIKTKANVKKRSKAIDLIVIHHTGGRTIGGAIAQAINALGPHYEIDPEGHVVKFVDDKNECSHAGDSRWDGKTSCNSFGIGIEIVHFKPTKPDKTPEPAITEAQYKSLIDLLKLLVKEHKLKPHRIVGHSDVRTTKADKILLGPDRQTCPGKMFEWTRLEAKGLGIIPKPGVKIEDDWGGYFEKYSEPLRSGDSDKKKVFGGKRRKDVSGVIVELQRDLSGIGYSLKVNGVFDKYTKEAVDRFKRHFFTGTRVADHPKSLAVNDRVDLTTANMIVSARMGIPGASTKPAPAAPKDKPGSKTGMAAPDESGEDDGDHGNAAIVLDDDQGSSDAQDA